MSLPQLLEFCKKDVDKDIYIAILEDDLEIPFCLPSIKNAVRYQKILSLANNTSFYGIIIEHIFKEIIQDSWLKSADNIPAGIPFTIVNLALHLSCQDDDFVSNTAKLASQYRNESKSILKTMKRKICSVFNGYTFEDCDKLSYPKLVEIFIEAEQILLENGIIDQEYQFTDGKVDKEAAVKSLHDQIRSDTKAYEVFNAVQAQARNEKAQEFREQQLRKAREEERRFRSKQ